MITDKDLDYIARAMQARQEVVLTRTLGNLSVTISTREATPVWGCDMLVRLEWSRGCVYSGQYFESAEDVKAAIKIQSFT